MLVLELLKGPLKTLKDKSLKKKESWPLIFFNKDGYIFFYDAVSGYKEKRGPIKHQTFIPGNSFLRYSKVFFLFSSFFKVYK